MRAAGYLLPGLAVFMGLSGAAQAVYSPWSSSLVLLTSCVMRC